MVMTVTCPSCSSSFPVDSDKVPEGGVNARCSACGDIFRVEKPAEPVTGVDELAPSVPEAPPAVAAPAAPEPPDLPEPVSAATDPLAGLDQVEVVPPREAPEEKPAPAAEESAVAGFTFGKRDPSDKAKRLARVLVSDMIMYNAERHQNALEAGTLTEDFEEEIDKSWKEYVEQVGPELAESDGRGFWKEALNEILAKGEEIF